MLVLDDNVVLGQMVGVAADRISTIVGSISATVHTLDD